MDSSVFMLIKINFNVHIADYECLSISSGESENVDNKDLIENQNLSSIIFDYCWTFIKKKEN